MEHIVCKLPGVQVPDHAEFEVKQAQGRKRLRGSADNVLYSGDLDNPTKYALAVESKDGSIKLVPTDFTELVVKAAPLEIEQQDAEQEEIWKQRTALGEAFGTKKAKSAIADRSRNRLDADSLEFLETSIVDRVKTSTQNLPNEERRLETMEVQRQIPPHNMDTANVKDVYPLDQLIPPVEFNAIDPVPIQLHGAEKLMWSDSAYVNLRLEKALETKGNTQKLRLLSYLSLLMRVYNAKRVTNKIKLMESLGNPPEVILSGIIDRFTVAKSGQVGKSHDRSFVFDPASVDKLLSYIMVLCLHINDYEVELQALGQDLGLQAKKMTTYLRNVGCQIRTREGNNKFGVLTAPLVLPDLVKKPSRR